MLSLSYSEAIVVLCDVFLDLSKCLKAFKQAILEYSVELMFNAGQESVLLVNVHAKLLKGRIPVELVEVEDAELVNDLAHTSLHLCLVNVLLVL